MANVPAKLDAVRFHMQLQEQQDLASCAALFRDAVAPFGFDTFACGEVDIADRDLNVFFIVEWSERWRKFYLGSGFIDRDPLLDALKHRRGPFTWSELRQDRQLSPLGREALRLTAEHGWTEGLAVPVRRGGTRFGLISLVGHGPRLTEYQRCLLCLISMSLLARIHILPGRAFPVAPAGLSNREIDCLRLVARGHSDRQIAAILGIAQSTAHQHVESARKRLKAQSRAQMAARAVSFGIIESA